MKKVHVCPKMILATITTSRVGKPLTWSPDAAAEVLLRVDRMWRQCCDRRDKLEGSCLHCPAEVVCSYYHEITDYRGKKPATKRARKKDALGRLDDLAREARRYGFTVREGACIKQARAGKLATKRARRKP